MKKITFGILFSAALIFTGCKNENQTEEVVEEDLTGAEIEAVEEVEDEVTEVTVTLESKSNTNVTGTAVFTEENGEVTMHATIMGLDEGTHAIHLHESADCSAEDASSAGGHWNPTFEDHGEWGSEEGYHKGDIGNFEVNAEGIGEIEFTTDEWCIGCGDEEKDILGTAVIVHDGVDDYTSQPSGAAGNRVACGELTKE